MIERRYVQELRAEGDGKSMSLSGYAATFGQESNDLGGFKEQLMPGCFSRALREGQDVRCLRNHDPNFVLGRTKNGTLQLKEDSRGLHFRCELDPENPEHRAVHSSVKRGDTDSMSFAFIQRSQDWADAKAADGSSYALRTLHDVDLRDVSPVTYPAYNNTAVQARSLEANHFFDAESAVECRAMLTALEAKRILETRGADIQVDTVGTAQPGFLPDELKVIWVKAFEDAYANALKMDKKGNVAIHCAISAANKAIDDKVAHAAEVDGKADPTPTPKIQNIEDDANNGKDAIGETDNDRAAKVLAEKREEFRAKGTHFASKPPDAEGRCPMCRCADCRCDCDDPDCWCQNTDVDPLNVWGDSDDNDDDDDRAAKIAPEIRASKKVRTKTVDGKNLPMSAFAYVGDPDKTETWKLPVHDKDHAQNALARENQADIPANKKAAVHDKIAAAAKKFGIHVSSEENSNDEFTQKAWMRLTEIKGR